MMFSKTNSTGAPQMDSAWVIFPLSLTWYNCLHVFVPLLQKTKTSAHFRLFFVFYSVSFLKDFSLRYKIYLLETLLLLTLRCLEHLKRSTSSPRFLRCLVLRPWTRARHKLKLERFISLRINSITSCSFKPN